jgi:hypothetical protein
LIKNEITTTTARIVSKTLRYVTAVHEIWIPGF